MSALPFALPSAFALALAAVASLLLPGTLPAAAGIANVRASQRAGTDLVDIRYDLDTTNPGGLLVRVSVSTNGGLSYTLPATHFSGDVGSGITAGANKLIVWDAARDWPEKFSTNVFFRLTAFDIPSSMLLIPAGSFTMGNCMSPSEGNSDELPLHTVYLSTFYMDKYLVTKSLWDTVYQWAIPHGYAFDNAGSGKASTHPVQSIDWYDCVKWCNARSEKEGRVPAYYTSAAQTTPYRTGQISVQNDWVNWNTGYRLPTEAEWEKAARGGASGHRFPWSDVDTITWSRANYYTYPEKYAYDLNQPEGYHPTFATGGYPYSSPMGYFAPNGYGLYDMAGNVWEWCWDWYGSYSSGSQTDPRSPASGSYRVNRGGSWYNSAFSCRTARRNGYTPGSSDDSFGFRSVLPPGQ